MKIAASDVLFLDTNVLLTATDESRPGHRDAKRLLGAAGEYGVHLMASGQIIREYLVVSTRPVEAKGLGLSPAAALKNVGAFQKRLVLHEETEAVSERLQELVREHQLRGKRIHNANVAATLTTHGVTKLVSISLVRGSKLAVGPLTRTIAGGGRRSFCRGGLAQPLCQGDRSPDCINLPEAP